MVNPAHAGMILLAIIQIRDALSKPRACGDDPLYNPFSYPIPM